MKTRTLPLAVLILVVAACGDGSGAVATPVPTTRPPETAETAPPPTTRPANPETTLVGPSLDAWLGTYSWAEFVEGDPGSDQTLVHELTLEEVTATGLSGSFSQNGFQTFVELTVQALPVDEAVEISVLTLDAGFSSYSPGDVLFRLSGDVDAPLTTVETLVTLMQPSGPGAFFVRGAGAVTTETPSDAVWVVDATTFDLLLVDTATGGVLDSVAGWGFDTADGEEGPSQVLQTVEVDANGRVWVDDCCEPAFGNTFGIDPDTDDSIEQAQVRLTGLNPRVSPSGDLVAIAIGDIGVGVFDAAKGALVVEPTAILALVTDADFAFPIPVAWANETTVAVAVPGDSTFTVSFVDVGDPQRPSLAAGPIEVSGVVLDGDFRADGTVAALVSPAPRSEARRLVILDRVLGVVEEVELADGTSGIDYDTAGNGLLIVTGDGFLQPIGEDPIENATGPFLDAARLSEP